MQNQSFICIEADFQEKIQTMNPFSSQPQQPEPQQLLLNNSSIVKKYSINTASSNIDQQEDQIKNFDKLTPKQLCLSNIELLEADNNCKINQNKGIYPTSFNLICIPKKKQNVSLNELMESNFSVLSYSVGELIKFSSEIIFYNDYVKSIFSKQNIEELIQIIASNYNKVSYHNFSHAFSLMQMNFHCVESMPKFKAYFTQQELFYTFISGISHDLNHNGTNNMFQVKTKSQLALLYNNQSVLQNMHISTLWRILEKNKKLNFLNKASDKIQAKHMITKFILSTDMSSHFKNLQNLQKKRKDNNMNLSNFQDRMFMMEQIFHSCDLGNPTLEYDSYISWAALLSHQFNQQVKLQRQNQVEVTKSFQYKNFSTLYNDQVWFVGKIVYPLWKELCMHLPQLSVFKKRIQQNTQILNQKLTEQQLKART